MDNRIIRLKLLIDSGFKGRQADLARAVGINAAQINQWLNGFRNMGEKSARKIERELCLENGWLDLAPLYIEGDDIFPTIKPKDAVPLISWVQAGIFCDSPNSFEPGDADEWITCPTPHGKHTFALTVKGDSMASQDGYNDGDTIFVDPDTLSKPNDDVVVRVESSYTFKRLRQGEQGFYLWALNESWNPRMIPLPDNFHVCGKVIGSFRKR